MKEYKYIINGTEYQVTIGDIVENIANVTVNGEDYKVEMEKEPEPEKKKVVVKTGGAAAQAAPACQHLQCPEGTTAGCHHRCEGSRWRHRCRWRYRCRSRSHEDGQQPRCREGRKGNSRSGESRRQCHGRHPTCCHRITFHKEPLFKGTRSCTPCLFCFEHSDNIPKGHSNTTNYRECPLHILEK